MAIIKGMIPSEWKGWEPRQTPRLVVPDGVVVSVDIELADGTLWPGRCLDISLDGALIEFSNDGPDVPVDGKALLTLKLDYHVAGSIPCLVRYCAGHRMGLFFPDPSSRTSEQNDRLFDIVRILERDLLRVKTQGQFG